MSPTLNLVKKIATSELSEHAQAAVFGLAAYAAMFAGILAASSLGVALA